MNPIKTLKLIQKLRAQSFIFIGSIFLLACSDPPGPNNCSLYKEGTFYYHFKDHNKEHYTITRKGPTQIEKNGNDSNIAEYKILWTDSCSYDLIYIKETNKLSKEMLDFKKKLVVHTTILSGTKEYYLFKSTSDLVDKVFEDTLWLTK